MGLSSRNTRRPHTHNFSSEETRKLTSFSTQLNVSLRPEGYNKNEVYPCLFLRALK
jgi:hypothetical protein